MGRRGRIVGIALVAALAVLPACGRHEGTAGHSRFSLRGGRHAEQGSRMALDAVETQTEIAAALAPAEDWPDEQIALDGAIPAGPGGSRERMIAKGATLVAEVEDGDSTLARVQAVFASRGGYVRQSRLETRGDGRKLGIVAGRVPAGAFDGAVAALTALCSKVRSVETEGTDITDEYHDIAGRLANRRALRERYRELFLRANATKDLLEIQKALADIDNEIDRLAGQQQLLDGRARLASISLQFNEPVPPGAAAPSAWRAALRNGVNGGVSGLANVLAGAMAALIVGIPTAAVLALIAFLTARLVKSRRRRRAPLTTRAAGARPGDGPAVAV